MKVSQFHNKNQFIIVDDDKIVFQSYQSTIAKIEKGILTLYTDWDYSHTTRKHLYLFLDECCHLLGRELREQLWTLNVQKNKRQFIQNLIDCGVIKHES